jgi:hypothetical protein
MGPVVRRSLLGSAVLAGLSCTPAPAPPVPAPPGPQASAAPRPSAEPPRAPETSSPGSADAAPPEGPPPPDAGADPETKAASLLAAKLLGEGAGEPIAYSSGTSTFVYLLKRLEEGNGEVQSLAFARAGKDPDEDLPICEPWDCEHDRDAKVEALLPTLTARLRGRGFELLTSTPWPPGKASLALATPPLTFRWHKDRLTVARSGKAPADLGRIQFSPPHTASPQAVAVVPDGSWLAVRILFDPGSAYGQGFNVYEEVHTYRTP